MSQCSGLFGWSSGDSGTLHFEFIFGEDMDLVSFLHVDISFLNICVLKRLFQGMFMTLCHR